MPASTSGGDLDGAPRVTPRHERRADRCPEIVELDRRARWSGLLLRPVEDVHLDDVTDILSDLDTRDHAGLRVGLEIALKTRLLTSAATTPVSMQPPAPLGEGPNVTSGARRDAALPELPGPGGPRLWPHRLGADLDSGGERSGVRHGRRIARDAEGADRVASRGCLAHRYVSVSHP